MKHSKQAMGLFLSPEWLHDFEDMASAIQSAADNGFGIIICFARHMHHNLHEPRVLAAVQAAAEASHRCGLQFVLDMDWAHWGGRSAEECPDMAMWQIVAKDSDCYRGQFEVSPAYEGGEPFAVEEISAVYGWDATGQVHRIPQEDYVLDQQDSFTSQYAYPSLDDDATVSVYRPRQRTSYVKIRGRIQKGAFTKVRVYVAMRTFQYPDVASASYLEAQQHLLERYAAVPLDGVAWDEPGKGGSLRGYKAGAGFMDFFQQENGYDLRERLLDLDQGESVEAIQTRRDYYTSLGAVNFNAQAAFNEQAKQQFGEDCFLGTHHTYSGMAMDIRCGCADYFKLGKLLTAAFTDTGWDMSSHSETVYNYTLADSLRKELNKPASYLNDWSESQRRTWYDYYTRMKMLYRIDWFSIFLGRYSEGFPTFPWDSHWKDLGRNAQQLQALSDALPADLLPESEMAVWLSWESQAYHEYSKYHYVRLWMTCNYNLSEQALKHSRFFDYVSSEALESAQVEDGCLILGGRRYPRLALPHASLIPAGVWHTVEACIQAGVEVVFIGTPPSRILETGVSLADRFAELCGIEPVDFADYDSWLTSHKPVPGYADWEPEQADFRFPVAKREDSETCLDTDGEIIAVRRGAVTWFNALDPREQFFRHLQSVPSSRPDLQHFGRASFRLFSGADTDSVVLVCMAPLYAELNEHFVYEGGDFQLCGGTWAVLELGETQLRSILQDASCVVASSVGTE
ncbi:hypothetical protein SH580_03275 [Coraliomargarita algicola]|uniref:Uncharacterized protein n=1 Tax=Coraliomargarita algicola TaxID=3092156 RepID=A0ABZ0RPQ9_9BACT|nr:hypothetical protein [Coraliomargarita sp. J2-16]WPJ96725.1 hypothetical protein SH580_03275 [Coraliomargarita sp. J2-16]